MELAHRNLMLQLAQAIHDLQLPPDLPAGEIHSLILERLVCREQSPRQPLQRDLEECSPPLRPGAEGLFTRPRKKLESELQSAECKEMVAGHLSNEGCEVQWASTTKGNQRSPGFHAQQSTPGTLPLIISRFGNKQGLE